MQQKNIIVPKTARYFCLGDPQKATEILIVLHGYGQLASYFLEHFRPMEGVERLIVAPEGLHRFYWERFSGRVVASWMTKEDRESDIADYICYLDAVYSALLEGRDRSTLRIHVIGFSQGAATAARWIARGKCKPETLVIWAGEFPKDIGSDTVREKFSPLRTIVVAGDQDEFISDVERYISSFAKKGMDVETIRYSGRHAIDAAALSELAGRLKV